MKNKKETSSANGMEWLWGAALFLLTCLVYLPALHGQFIWDDSFMVTDNKMLRDQQGLHTLWFTNKAADPYRITMTAFWLEWQLWGEHPMGFHIINIVTHALGALLLWRVLRQLSEGGKLFRGAWLAAAVFALHPVCAASAAWVSEQKNTFSIIFFLLTILWYLRFEDSGRRWDYALALFLYVCALMSKGSVVMLPVALLLIAWWRRGKLARKDWLRTAPYFALSFAAGLMTIWFQNHKAIGGEMVQDLSKPARVAAAAWAVWFYLWKALVPLNICVIYPQWHVNAASMLDWIPAILLLGVFFICWRYRKGWGKHVLLGLGYFTVTLFPVMGFFNMYFLVFSRVADHWQYLALPGIVALAVGAGVYWFGQLAVKYHFPKPAGFVVAGALLAFLAVSTWIRAGTYTTEEKLWSDTVAKNPKAWMAYNNLGNALGAEGKTDEAIVMYNKGLEVNPVFPDAHSNLGNSLVAKGRLDEAVEHFKQAIQGEPKMGKFHFNYGVALFDQRKWDEAIQEYQTALQLEPGNADARNNLANVYIEQKKYNQGLEQALIAIQIKPSTPEPYLNAANALVGLGRIAEAAQYYDKTLALRPNNASAHYEYGMMLAMHGDLASALVQFQTVINLHPEDAAAHSSLGNTLAGLKRLDDAIEQFRIAIRLAPKDPENYNNLATAFAEQGNLDEAATQYIAAIQINPKDPGTHSNFAYTLLRQGKRAEALAQYQEALRLKPGDPFIQQQIQTLLR